MTKNPRRTRDRLRNPETGEWDVEEVRYRSKGWIAVVVAIAILAGGVWVFGGRAWNMFMDFRTREDYVGEGIEDVKVDIPRGSTMRQIGEILQEADVVKSADTFRRYAQSRPDEAEKVQAGSYKMRIQISAMAAFERLLNPAYIVRNMMQLREGQRTSELIASMAQQSGVPQEDFEAIVNDPEQLRQLGLPEWAGDSIDGFLFPDTYELPSNPTAAGLMKTVVSQFNEVAQSIDFAERARQSPAGDPYRALVMAAVVEREASSDEDRAKAARVFYNRLAQGQPLQSDATVAYANNVTGRVTTTEAERRLDSPYNTYLYQGLPPTPITSPAQSAMEAAVSPAEGNWLYFVVINLDTGETVFSDTYDQHLLAVRRWQEFCRGSDKC